MTNQDRDRLKEEFDSEWGYMFYSTEGTNEEAEHYRTEFFNWYFSKIESEIEKYKKNEHSHRPSGKSIESYVTFFFEGKKDKSVIYATPKGSFYSPKAHKQTVDSQIEVYRKRVVGEVKAYQEIYDDIDTWDICDEILNLPSLSDNTHDNGTDK